jgi:biopolymer transport protein ExbD
MAFKLNRSSKEPMSEINVTPFVDVMLVLLIIFMVTAPLLTVGVQGRFTRELSRLASRRVRAAYFIN